MVVRILQISQITFFLMLLAIPAAFLNHDKGKVIKLEKRQVTPKPEFFHNGELNRDFSSLFDKFWNDNVGWREEAIALKKILAFTVFDRYEDPLFIQGKGLHLYYTGHNLVLTKNVQGTNHISADEIRRQAGFLSTTHNYFKMRGIPFVFVGIPDKERVYPEYYPEGVVQRPERRPPLESVMLFAQMHTPVRILNMLPILESHRHGNDELLYFKNDDAAHWNPRGAFIGFQSMVKVLNSIHPGARELQESDFINEPVETRKFIEFPSGPNYPLPFSEVYYRYVFKEKDTFIKRPVDDLLPIGSYGEFHKTRAAYFVNPANKGRPKILLIGDSYVYTFLLPNFARSYSEVLYIHYSSAPLIKQATEKLSPDIVMMEQVERMFYYRHARFDYLAELR